MPVDVREGVVPPGVEPGVRAREIVVGHNSLPLGELTAISSGGAHDNYEVTMADGQKFLVPAVPAFILDINIEAGRMTIQPIPGLLPDKTSGA